MPFRALHAVLKNALGFPERIKPDPATRGFVKKARQVERFQQADDQVGVAVMTAQRDQSEMVFQ
jgi:hypothetical protein